MLVKVSTQRVGGLETLEATVVPVDDIYHRSHTSQDYWYFPVALVVGLSCAGEDKRQGGGLLYVRHVVCGVVHRCIPQEVEIRCGRRKHKYLFLCVLANLLALQGIHLLGARHSVLEHYLQLLLQWLMTTAEVGCKANRCTERTVEYGQLPILLVVYLTVAG